MVSKKEVVRHSWRRQRFCCQSDGHSFVAHLFFFFSKFLISKFCSVVSLCLIQVCGLSFIYLPQNSLFPQSENLCHQSQKVLSLQMLHLLHFLCSLPSECLREVSDLLILLTMSLFFHIFHFFILVILHLGNFFRSIFQVNSFLFSWICQFSPSIDCIFLSLLGVLFGCFTNKNGPEKYRASFFLIFVQVKHTDISVFLFYIYFCIFIV